MVSKVPECVPELFVFLSNFDTVLGLGLGKSRNASLNFWQYHLNSDTVPGLGLGKSRKGLSEISQTDSKFDIELGLGKF